MDTESGIILRFPSAQKKMNNKLVTIPSKANKVFLTSGPSDDGSGVFVFL